MDCNSCTTKSIDNEQKKENMEKILNGNNVDFQDKVNGIQELQNHLDNADLDEISKILKEHISFGNTKLPKKIGIFNLGSAKDCVNAQTPSCQAWVDGEDKCYARKSEKAYDGVLDYRRRQIYLWDYLTAEQFATAFIKMCGRKRNNVAFLRFNESGDFRTQSDVEKAEKIARIIKQRINVDTYTYTASDHLDFNMCDYLVVNASNADIDGYAQRFTVVEDKSEIPDDGFICPQDCSVCHACMSDGGTSDIYELLH